MTVYSTETYTDWVATDGVKKNFNYDFTVFLSTDMYVLLREGVDGEEVRVDSGFTMTPTNPSFSGGVITYPSSGAAIAAGSYVRLVREVDYTQTQKIGNEGAFRPDIHERGFDRLTQQTQQLADALSRALVVPIGQIPPSLAELLALLNSTIEALANAEFIYKTKPLAAAATIPSAVSSVRLTGDADEGDGLGGLYIDTDNGSAETFVSSGATSRTWYRAADVGFARLTAALAAAVALGETAVQPEQNLISYVTRAAAAAKNLTSEESVEIRKWAFGSKVARAVYVKVGAEPTHEMKFQDTAGNWFEFKDIAINLYQAGAMGGGAVNDTSAIQRGINYAKGFGVEGKTRSELRIPSDQFLHYGLSVDRALTMIGDYRGSTLLCGLGVTVPGISVATQHDGFDYYSGAGAPPCRVVFEGVIIKHLDKNDLPGRNVAHGISLRTAVTNPVYCAFEFNGEIFAPPGDGINVEPNTSAVPFMGKGMIHKLYANGAYRDNLSLSTCYDWRIQNVDLLYAGRDGFVFSGCAGINTWGFKSYSNVRNGGTIYQNAGGLPPVGGSFTDIAIDTNGEHGILFADGGNGSRWIFTGGNIGNNSRKTANTYDDIHVTQGAENLIIGAGFCFDRTFAVLPASKYSRNSIYFAGGSGTAAVDCRAAEIIAGNPVDPAIGFTNDTSRVIGAAAIDKHYGKFLSTGSSAGYRVANPANNTQFDELGFGGLYSSTKGDNRMSWDGNGIACSDQLRLVPGPYADDAAALAGGVQHLGGLYRKTDGTVRWLT